LLLRRPGGCHESRLVGEHDRLHAIADPELREHVADVLVATGLSVFKPRRR
jgi:hypothetical protein